MDKYSRQSLFAKIGQQGQERIRQAAAVMVGCGAVGTVVASSLVRSGIGRLRIIDRDFVEPSNLQRQVLFDEADACDAVPKAAAAADHLRSANSDTDVDGIVEDLTPRNAEELLSGFPLILDGTDNFETRLLMNDVSIALNIPWIYAAAVGSYGVSMTVRPGQSACLACLLAGDEVSAIAAAETCDTAGILGAAAGVIASIESAEALKLLVGEPEVQYGRLVSCDVWTGRFQSVRTARDPRCRACARREFTYLSGAVQPHVTMCGRDSVQIHEHGRRLDLGSLRERLAASVPDVRTNGFLLRFRVAPYEMTVFPDGRAIVKGTRDAGVARSLYARYVGS